MVRKCARSILVKQGLFNINFVKKHLNLDPRTKLLILLLNSIFVFGGIGGDTPFIHLFRHVLVALPFIFLYHYGKKKLVLLSALFYIIFYFVQITIFSHLQGMANYIVLFCIGFFVRMLPNVISAYLVVSTTKVRDLIAAMKKMHMSDKLIIPLAVIIRFFPVIAEEGMAISNAMRMRGIGFGGKHRTKILEYRMISLVICSVKAGEDLSAAALSRGLGSPLARTNLSNIGFKVCDYIIFIFVVAFLGAYITTLF